MRPLPPSSDLPADTAAPSWPWVWLPALVAGALAWALRAEEVDHRLFMAWNAAAQRWAAPAAWSAVTLTGSVLGAIALFAPSLKTRPRWLGSALLAAAPGVLFSQGGKRLFDEMRPAGVLPPDSFTLIGEKLYVYAFPSGHATTAFVMAAVLVLAWPSSDKRWMLALLALPLAGLVAFSRVAVGAHWPLDVATGAAGGWLIGALGVWLSARLRFWQHAAGQRGMALLTFFASMALMILNLGYPEARLFQIGLAAWGVGGAASVLLRERKTL